MILIKNCLFRESQSEKSGGIMFIYYSGNITVKNCLFFYCEAQFGGAIYYEESKGN